MRGALSGASRYPEDAISWTNPKQRRQDGNNTDPADPIPAGIGKSQLQRESDHYEPNDYAQSTVEHSDIGCHDILYLESSVAALSFSYIVPFRKFLLRRL
jgi:hypothetical protein